MYIDENFIKERIVNLRNNKGVSARDMSLSIGQNESYINSIENGKIFPSLRGLILICEYLDITLKDFFDNSNTNPSTLNQIIQHLKKLKPKQLEILLAFVSSFDT